ncbi:TraR/DksA C4-type zinc finger protein [Bacillus sp. CECT 9360]|uniref:TraR/DksA C4-type zinc finger protein n=1 Tax=Bacillus sp. CECT 9360 TaxID=2845821 RepID=UPI001E558688|nr:TraR/DksA C4-type zinc finger protein [Bacillus sp. CECT 9360]CAH0346775.1 RNA polymerase-binding transcription factor DksA [Bacillus sp. CECT 9360]
MATREQITTLKEELLNHKEELQDRVTHDREDWLGDSQSDAVGELSAYDNHPADMGTELFERERNMAIDNHAESEIEKIDSALQAIEEGSYGTCKICGKEIPYERLEAVPATLYCVDHTPDQNAVHDRPVEEEVLEPSHGDHFENRRKGNDINDKEDSFGEVARFGTSETPSDYTGDHESYDTLYKTVSENDRFTEEYESFLGNDMDGKNRKAYPSKKQEEYEDLLDEENIESPLGDVPYKRSDGYVDNDKK